jgi:hypothetical protein
MATEVRGAPGPHVDIVIVNWNSPSLLRECLSALDQSTIADTLNVVIVDNASTDGSADALMARHVRLDLVRNPENRGFAAACNRGVRRSCCSSIRMCGSGWTRRRARHATWVIRSIAVLASSGCNCSTPGAVFRVSCARAPTAGALLLQPLFLDRICPALVPRHFLTEWDHGDTRPVDQVMGAFLMIRRAGLTSVSSYITRTSTCAWPRGRPGRRALRAGTGDPRRRGDDGGRQPSSFPSAR